MNSATLSDEEPGAGGFFYFIGITVGVLGIIVSIVIAYHYCARNQNPTQPPQQILSDQSVSIGVGLDEAILDNYPELLYAEVTTQNNKHNASSCCSICLADYANNDMLRLLPNCGHLFHLKCVDPWLLQHPSCPICRSSPMTTPQLAPSSHMVSLVNRMV
ncbi:hypothetical protein C5167_046968 [Papaver somniferum]|uniref:RING-type domain-containing protein n=1 Tax=Papaver somniferum TaxID=3469 RepID=A0A4Y7LIW2_PAPSO|nr:hypothetical protein C5167_046968 [Papaver somniferum]